MVALINHLHVLTYLLRGSGSAVRLACKFSGQNCKTVTKRIEIQSRKNGAVAYLLIIVKIPSAEWISHESNYFPGY